MRVDRRLKTWRDLHVQRRALVPGLLALALTGCLALQEEIKAPDSSALGATVADARTAHRTNDLPLGVVAHGTRMGLNLYAGGATLPDGHVLPESEAVAMLAAVPDAATSTTWIGHSTMLIRAGGLWILTDPIFSDTATPLPPLGVRRLVAPGVALDALPPIDVVLISHDHFDHLDLWSLKQIARRNPSAVALVPDGLGPVVSVAGFARVVEHDWFDRTPIDTVTFVATPAVHGSVSERFGGRGQGWSAGAIMAPDARIFFAGDTAWHPVFAEIRSRLGRFDVALVPIGAYGPEPRENPRHANPEQALQLADDLGARIAIGMHWGTFALTPEPPVEAKARFLAAEGRADARALRIGETVVLNRGR